jgi:myo-inositol-1(or 4)-monophosphatase
VAVINVTIEFEFTPQVAVSESQRSAYLAFAMRTARLAGAATLPYFRAEIKVENKLSDGRFDPVTQADKSAEAAIRRSIEDEYPEHGIMGEEFGFKPGNGLTWVIDPIDGTRAFMSGMLHWGVLLGLFDGEDPVLGVMYQPYTDELFAGDGSEAFLYRGNNIRRLTTGNCSSLGDAVLATTGSDWFRGEDALKFQALRDAARMCRYGGDCYLFAMVAMGYVHLGTDGNLNSYDILPLVPIIRGAGGVVTDYEGGNPSLGGTILASANAALHESALSLIA